MMSFRNEFIKLFSPLLEQKANRAITRKTRTLSFRNIAANEPQLILVIRVSSG